MDPYSQSGYKNGRGRDQARAFKQPFPAFLAPGGGFPAEVASPPPPPPVVPVVAGGAAASSAALPLGALAAGVAGLALGAEVRKDIKRFEKNAKLPFYDADNIFTGGVGWKTNPHWVKSSDEVMYDQKADELYKDHLYDLLKNYTDTQGGGDPYWIYHRATRWRINVVGGNKYGPHNNGRFTHFYGYSLGIGANIDVWDYAGWALEWNWVATGFLQRQPYPPGVAPTHCDTGICVLPDPVAAANNHRYYERWLDPASLDETDPSDDYYDVTTGTVWRKRNFVSSPFPVTTFTRGHGTPLRIPSRWDEATASPGSQPSLEEQQAAQELPKGKSKNGYYVPIPVNYPFTLIHTAPGGPPVSVPDVVIDTVEGVGILPPSGPVHYGTSEEVYEKKPWNRFKSGMHVAMSIATEASDFMEAMHKGLPKKHRSKGRWGVLPDADVVLLDILHHWDEWDADLAMEYFVNNQIEDEVLGKYYFGTMGKLSEAKAFGFGVRGTGGGAQYVPIPEVHFANGQHSVSMGEHSIDLVTGSAH